VSQAREASTIVSIRETAETAEQLGCCRGQRVCPRHELAKLVDHVRLVVVRLTNYQPPISTASSWLIYFQRRLARA
jgi:hypothetical protein